VTERYPGVALTRERPILMGAPMIHALLAGRKTQTRRVFKLPKMANGRWFAARGPHLDRIWYSRGSGQYLGGNPDFTGDQPPCAIIRCDDNTSQHVPCPYGFPLDRLWVKETFGRTTGNGVRIVYRADGEEPKELLTDRRVTGMKWTSPIFMRREHSRITLEVTEVRVERVQAITEADAAAEGIVFRPSAGGIEQPNGFCGWHEGAAHPVKGTPKVHATAAMAYRDLWDSINGVHAGCAWAANPWVWVIGFKRIDAVLAEEPVTRELRA